MNLRDLLGKKVLRTAPVIYSTGNLDKSYCDTDVCISVIAIVSDTPILKFESKMLGTKVSAVPIEFDDNNWKDATEIWDYIDEANKNINIEKENNIKTDLKYFIDSLDNNIDFCKTKSANSFIDSDRTYYTTYATVLKNVKKDLTIFLENHK